MTTAQDRGWGAPPADPRLTVLVVKPVRTGHVVIRCHRSIAELVSYLLDRITGEFNYELFPEQCGGYNPRYISGTTIWSNHAWGLALDLNWQQNPMTFDGVNHTNLPFGVIDMMSTFMFRWGGSYPGSKKDPMHFEFMGTPADAATLTASINRPMVPNHPETVPPLVVPPPAPGAPSYAVQEWPGRYLRNTGKPPYMTGEDVLHVQWGIGFVNSAGLALDKAYGPSTERAVKNFQQKFGLTADGIVGAQTWSALEFGIVTKLHAR